MAKRPVIIVPDPVLKTVSNAVSSVDAAVQKQMDDMLETMYDGGIGLAANQIGVTNRVLVMDVPEGCWEYDGTDKNGILQVKFSHRDESALKPNPILMANPEILKSSEERSVFYLEGCLSIPGQFAEIERPAHVTVKYLDREGKEHIKDFSGLDSHCVQHEIDHLNGVLFIDYLSKIKRNTLLRKLEKAKKQGTLL